MLKSSQNLFALIRAYDLDTPDVVSRDDFRVQSQHFINLAAPYEGAIGALVAHSALCNTPLAQFCFNALMSIAIDVGLDFLYLTSLPDLVTAGAGKKAISDAIRAIPAFSDRLRPTIADELKLYCQPCQPRRLVEADLFFGNVAYAIGRHKNAAGQILYGPYALHPFFRFLSR